MAGSVCNAGSAAEIFHQQSGTDKKKKKLLVCDLGKSHLSGVVRHIYL